MYQELQTIIDVIFGIALCFAAVLLACFYFIQKIGEKYASEFEEESMFGVTKIKNIAIVGYVGVVGFTASACGYLYVAKSLVP